MLQNLLISLAITFFSAIILTKIIIKFAYRLKLIDYPNNRSSHDKPTPRGGGIAIVLSIVIGILFFDQNIVLDNKLLFIALLSVTAIGIFDDLISTNPILKFVVIGVSSSLLFISDFQILDLGTWFGYVVPLGYLAFPVTIFSVVGYTNSINLVDGLDGLAAKISVVILSALAYIGFVYGDSFILNFSLISISALLAFLIFNWNPAKIFQGDSGSLTIGFIISIISIKAITYINTSAILLIAFVPILDTLVVMLRRIMNGLSPFQPDKTHIHHLIVRQKRGRVKRSVLIMFLLQVMYSVIGLNMLNSDSVSILSVFSISVFVFYEMFTIRTKSVKKEKKKELIEEELEETLSN